MFLEELVVSLETAKKLQSAGIEFPKSCFVWGWKDQIAIEHVLKRGSPYVNMYQAHGYVADAPTLAEVLELLPPGEMMYDSFCQSPHFSITDQLHVRFYFQRNRLVFNGVVSDESFVDAAARILLKAKGRELADRAELESQIMGIPFEPGIGRKA